MELFRRTYGEINHDNLRHNWSYIKSIAQDDRFICPMVKANAYGHGDVEIAHSLQEAGASTLGVCLLEEALHLRHHGINCEILVFRGFDRRGAEVMLDNQLTPVVSQWSHLEALEGVLDEPVKVHVKFNTGMSRLGFEVTEAERILAYFKKSKKIKLKAILTHLADGDDFHNPEGMSRKQLQKISEVKDILSPLKPFAHVLNSGGILSLQNDRKNNSNSSLLQSYSWGFRPGIMLYGYHTSTTAESGVLKPVMSLRSVIETIRTIDVGESVSYSGIWRAQRASKIAVVPLGYADGLHRAASNQTRAVLKGEFVNLVGRICMDFVMLDVTDLVQKYGEDDLLNEEVTFFGYTENDLLKQTATEAAQSAGTISYEVLTSVSGRVPRQHKGLRKT